MSLGNKTSVTPRRALANISAEKNHWLQESAVSDETWYFTEKKRKKRVAFKYCTLFVRHVLCAQPWSSELFTFHFWQGISRQSSQKPLTLQIWNFRQKLMSNPNKTEQWIWRKEPQYTWVQIIFRKCWHGHYTELSSGLSLLPQNLLESPEALQAACIPLTKLCFATSFCEGLGGRLRFPH